MDAVKVKDVWIFDGCIDFTQKGGKNTVHFNKAFCEKRSGVFGKCNCLLSKYRLDLDCEIIERVYFQAGKVLPLLEEFNELY